MKSLVRIQKNFNYLLYEKEDINEVEWQEIGIAISQTGESLQWIIGDWLAIRDRRGWADDWKTAKYLTGYSVDYLKKCKATAASFPVGLREHYESLPYSHLRIIGLSFSDPRDKIAIADYAINAEVGMNARELEAYCKNVNNGDSPESTEEAETPGPETQEGEIIQEAEPESEVAESETTEEAEYSAPSLIEVEAESEVVNENLDQLIAQIQDSFAVEDFPIIADRLYSIYYDAMKE